MPYHFFALMSRMRNIRRWGLMANTFEENIQEHSLMVAMIAHALAVIRRDIFHQPADPDKAASAALYHDAAEILTGDLPTPIKYYNPAINDAYKQVEKLSSEKLFSMLPEALRDSYAPMLFAEKQDPTTRQIVHAADKLSAYIKCLQERRASNAEFTKAEEQIRKALEQNPLPEVSYFMEHFIPSFLLTIYEQE